FGIRSFTLFTKRTSPDLTPNEHISCSPHIQLCLIDRVLRFLVRRLERAPRPESSHERGPFPPNLVAPMAQLHEHHSREALEPLRQSTLAPELHPVLAELRKGALPHNFGRQVTPEGHHPMP